MKYKFNRRMSFAEKEEMRKLFKDGFAICLIART